MKKKVYVSLSADILHKGHISILKKASQLGEVTVGLMTDKAINSYKKIPFLNYFQREIVLKNLKMVKKVIPQSSFSYKENLHLHKPDFVVHGNDWKYGIQKKYLSLLVGDWGHDPRDIDLNLETVRPTNGSKRSVVASQGRYAGTRFVPVQHFDEHVLVDRQVIFLFDEFPCIAAQPVGEPGDHLLECLARLASPERGSGTTRLGGDGQREALILRCSPQCRLTHL